MLKLSTKGRYGLRAMIVLADEYGNGPVMMSHIAETENVSRKYLHSLLTDLKSRKLVKSVLGARGGYLLTKPPSEVMVMDIFESLEGPLAIVDCLNCKESCNRIDNCRSFKVWNRVNDAIVESLAGVTLDQVSKELI